MSNALSIRRHTSTAPKPYVTGKQIPRSGDGVIDPQQCLDACAAKHSAEEDAMYGGPKHIQEKAKEYDRTQMDAFAKRWNMVR